MNRIDVDVAVIGGGAAGLTAAGVAASFGARTLLVERHRLGGDCTWTGCIPSKTLLHAARVAASARRAPTVGVETGPVRVDFARVIDHVRAVRERVYAEADAPEVLAPRGVETLAGRAAFTGPRELAVRTADGGSVSVRFRRAVIATGSSPAIPDVPGLAEAGYLTHETLFELTELPRRVAVLGGGPVGVELSQALRRLGAEVTLVTRAARLLPRDEPEAAGVLQKQLEVDGVNLLFGNTFHGVERGPGGLRIRVGPDAGPDLTLEAEAILVAAGRRPNLDGLDLDRAGVRAGPGGIPVDRRCRTSAGSIYAAGDVTPFLDFTHVAENMARTAAAHAVFRLPVLRYETGTVPWVTYTDPEVARVGRSAEELRRAGARFHTLEFPYARIDRAVTENAGEGLIRIHAVPARRLGWGGGRILGASAAGWRAGEAITELALAMKQGIGLPALAGTIHPYPTLLLGVRRAADQDLLRRQKRWMVRLVRALYRYRGRIPDYVGRDEVL